MTSQQAVQVRVYLLIPDSFRRCPSHIQESKPVLNWSQTNLFGTGCGSRSVDKSKNVITGKVLKYENARKPYKNISLKQHRTGRLKIFLASAELVYGKPITIPGEPPSSSKSTKELLPNFKSNVPLDATRPVSHHTSALPYLSPALSSTKHYTPDDMALRPVTETFIGSLRSSDSKGENFPYRH